MPIRIKVISTGLGVSTTTGYIAQSHCLERVGDLGERFSAIYEEP